MWSHDYELTTPTDPSAVWRLLADVAGWGEWNAGIETIEVDGPVAVGTTFRMTPPGESALTSTVVALEPGRLITDETVMDGLVIRVAHEVEPQPGGDTTIRYRIEVSGPAADAVGAEVGAAVSADFPEVMAALAERAGRSTERAATLTDVES